MKKFTSVISALLVVGLCVSAQATQIVNYGWEDGGTTLGWMTGAPNTDTLANVTDIVHDGSSSLKLTSPDATNSYNNIAWIKGLTAGDVVTASIWVYDTTPAGTGTGSPSGRIWGHYNDSATDVTVSNGSASGNSTYSDGTGWSQLSYTWTIGAGHTGLVVEARMYDSTTGGGKPGDAIWIDDLSVTAPDAATVVLPTPEPATMAILGLGALALRIRRK